MFDHPPWGAMEEMLVTLFPAQHTQMQDMLQAGSLLTEKAESYRGAMRGGGVLTHGETSTSNFRDLLFVCSVVAVCDMREGT